MDVSMLNLDKVSEAMEDRGISAEEICAVIEYAEGGGLKLIDGDRILAKKRLDKIMVYVEYNAEGGSYVVADTYAHRVVLNEEA